ncbi:hypothetical protein FOL47_006421 [Perkinsus chesapeaki]|uniref:Aspartyl/asparaginy/proline hydroxylase domain-containing protein n=1 Tax=Perkinsus chesapeaki TaxID=330153 RepID=A0A7J6LS05_PERCH|nr:hypothetical protein FOL47_006421 [Perkinsus chesapeaki]
MALASRKAYLLAAASRGTILAAIDNRVVDAKFKLLERNLAKAVEQTTVQRTKQLADAYLDEYNRVCRTNESSSILQRLIRSSQERADALFDRAVTLYQDLLHQVVEPEGLHACAVSLLEYRRPELYPYAVGFARKLALHPVCTAEFATKSPFQERATQYHYATSMVLLKQSGHWELAEQFFEEARKYEWSGERPIQWTSILQTPAIFIPGLRAPQVWWDDDRELPMNKVLLDNRGVIERELRASIRGVRWTMQDVQPMLTDPGGKWQSYQLYTERAPTAFSDAIFPKTSKRLIKALPGKTRATKSFQGLPYVSYNNEEITIIRMTPGMVRSGTLSEGLAGTKVVRHNGGTNARLTSIMGLIGCEGVWVGCGDDERELKPGEIITFDDSVDHWYRHEGSEEHWHIVVGTMHPDLVEKPWIFTNCFNGHTEFEKIRLDKLQEYKKMADEIGSYEYPIKGLWDPELRGMYMPTPGKFESIANS